MKPGAGCREFSRKPCSDCVESQRWSLRPSRNNIPAGSRYRNFSLEKEGALFRRYKVALVSSQVFLDPSGKEVYPPEGLLKPTELIKKLRELKFTR
jgi:hypothetical protein